MSDPSPAVPTAVTDMPSFGFLYSAPLVDNVSERLPYIPHQNEWQWIKRLLSQSNMAVRAVMKAATKVNLMEFLLGDFKVIHFTGHGVSQAELLLENEDGSVASMERAVLWELLSNGVGRNLRLLFLSCCGAENIIARTPEGAESGIAHVVAVARGVEITVQSAEAFCKHFYQLLFSGSTVARAFASATSVSGCRDFVLLPKSAPHDEVLFPRPRTPAVPQFDENMCPSHLQHYKTPFVGRQREVSEVISQLLRHDSGRCVAVTGRAGIGKTCVALKAANFLRDRCQFPGGVYQLNLGGLSDFADEHLKSVMSQLAMQSTGPDRRVLLVLDACDVDERSRSGGGGVGVLSGSGHWSSTSSSDPFPSPSRVTGGGGGGGGSLPTTDSTGQSTVVVSSTSTTVTTSTITSTATTTSLDWLTGTITTTPHKPPPITLGTPTDVPTPTGRRLIDLVHTLNDIVDTYPYTSLLLTLPKRPDGVHALKDVELTAMDANDASVLFATLYHNKLDMATVQQFVDGKSCSRDVVKKLFAGHKMMRALQGLPRAIQIAATRVNLTEDVPDRVLMQVMAEATISSRVSNPPTHLFSGLFTPVTPASTVTVVTPLLPHSSSTSHTHPPRHMAGFPSPQQSGRSVSVNGAPTQSFHHAPSTSLPTPVVTPIHDRLPGVDFAKIAFEGQLCSVIPDPEARQIWVECGTKDVSASVHWEVLFRAFNTQLLRHFDGVVTPRQVSEEEFMLFRANCLGAESAPAVTVAQFSEFWVRWLGPVFNLLIRIKEIWCQYPRLIYIVAKDKIARMLTRPGEFMLRISEGTPGALAFSYRPAKPPQNNPSGIMHTRVYPTSTGYDMEVVLLSSGAQSWEHYQDIPTLLLSMDQITTFCNGGGNIRAVATFLQDARGVDGALSYNPIPIQGRSASVSNMGGGSGGGGDGGAMGPSK